MLTPSRKVLDCPFQTPSPVHSLKRSPRNGKENCSRSTAGPLYQLVPDEDATKEFVWAKKEKRDRKRKYDSRENREKKRNLSKEHKDELEKLKKRRLERDRIHEQRMKDREDLRTLQLAGEYEDWIKEEEAFMLRQAKVRTRLRLEAGRPEPVDLLMYFKENGRTFRSEDFPLNVIGRLSFSELCDLIEDIKVCKKIEDDVNCVYWDDVYNVVERYLQECKNEASRPEGINQAVSCDVKKILSGKTSNQLLLLQRQVKNKIQLHSENIDVSFWECLLSNINFYISYARLYETQNVSKGNVTYQHGQSKEKKKGAHSIEKTYEIVSNVSEFGSEIGTSENGNVSDQVKSTRNEIDKVVACVTCEKPTTSITKNYIRRDIDIFEEQYSPKYLKESEIDKDVVITDPKEDLERLALARERVREIYTKNNDSGDSCDSYEEINISSEYHLMRQSYSWDSTFRPRKPRYFNRVITGFVWNRYNRTHYDIDNPPPKSVRGYKFCIFYQDLIDKSETPVYSITPCPDESETDILRFVAGPPYEDVAFKIVRGEWDKSVKRGYRCTFNGRVLELYFRFRHMCYRR